MSKIEKSTYPAIGVMLESRAKDLLSKGVLGSAMNAYDPAAMFEKVVLFSPYVEDLEVKNELQELGLFLEVHGVRLRRPWTLPFGAFRLRRQMTRHSLTILRCSNSFFACLFGSLVAKTINVRSFAWVGGDNRLSQSLNKSTFYGSSLLAGLLEKAALCAVSAVFVPNEFTATYVKRVGKNCVSDKISILPWVVKERKSEQITPERILQSEEGGSHMVLVVGQLNRYKFSEVLYDVVEKVLSDLQNIRCRFVFCGDGELGDEGRRRFKENSDVVFTGFVGGAEVDALMSEASVVCVPMSGFVLLEAARQAKPVVAGNIEWHPELVRDGTDGLLVDPGSADQWGEAIVSLLQRRDIAENLGTSLNDRFELGYSSEVTVPKWRDAIASLIEGER